MTPYRFITTITTMADSLGADFADIRRDGNIVGVDWSIVGGTFSLGFAARAGILFSATDAFNNSDTQLMISEVAISPNVFTTAPFLQINKFTPLNVYVTQGERLYLSFKNSVGPTVTGTLVVSALLWIADKGSERRLVRS